MKNTNPIAATGLVALMVLSACSKQTPAAPADAKSIMSQHVQPEAQVYWNAVQYISDENGSREIVPRNDAEWARPLEAARKLKQLGLTLKQPAYSQGKGSDWQEFAQGLVDTAGKAEAAAYARSPEQILEVGGTLYNVCSACHEVYMPISGNPAPAGQSSATPAG